MSEWYLPRSTDIELDVESREVDILVTANEYGNIYATLTFNQIRSLWKRIEAIENGKKETQKANAEET